MFSQFQSRYPAGSLTSELLQIHEGSFVVRVTLQVGGAALATGMAAASTIEEAEDQARLRALGVLGIYPSGSSYQTQAQLMAADEDFSSDPPARLNPARNRASTFRAARDQQAQPDQQAEWEFPSTNFEPELDDHLFRPAEPPGSNGGRQGLPKHSLDPSEIAAQESAQPEKRKPARDRSSAAKPMMATPEPAPLDLSDIIAQTSVELKRLGWNESQGRSHLQRAYGKRSRQQLTDDELLDFLQYLQHESSPEEPSF
ncbi:MAG: hypothetical protein KME35_10220 [Aphanocapsa sp. GSE-SYN-MK-11-07L]|jgi:hypothetical protein|nr:hypothetical protein [Aphanocapsa sp. GSE-SYN-MK-11-07L]